MTNAEKAFSLRLYERLLLDAADMCNCSNATKLAEDYRVLRSRLLTEGHPFLTEVLPSLGKALDRALSSDTPLDTGRKPGSDQRPEFLRSFWSGVFDRDGRLLPSPSIACVRALRQILYLYYKYRLPYEPSKVKKTLDSFVQIEAELAQKADSDFDDPIIDCARDLIGRLLCNFDYRGIKPRHGPGAVSTGEKYHRKMTFSRIYLEIERVYPFSEYYMLRSDPNEVEKLQQLQPLAAGTTKVVLVDKDSRGPRIISCEPLEYQWIQQGLGRAIMAFLEEHPWTRARINFADQVHNQRYAYLGSLDRRWATLDMKDASDRVSIALVERCFAHTSLLEALMACRSYWCRLPDGRVCTMLKYAPMGSALCFPVEALVFWALTVATQIIHGKVPMARAMGSTFVYGDDIIVPREQTHAVLQNLPRFGLMFNNGKCCIDGFFRESCGAELFMGSDVKPTRLRSRWSSSQCPEALASYVCYSNALRRTGYWRSADMIKSAVEAHWGPLPYVSSLVGEQLSQAWRSFTRNDEGVEIPLLGWADPVCHGAVKVPCRVRFNKELQRQEILCWRVEPVKHQAPCVPDGELLSALADGRLRGTNGRYVKRRRVTAKRRWTDVSQLNAVRPLLELAASVRQQHIRTYQMCELQPEGSGHAPALNGLNLPDAQVSNDLPPMAAA